MISPSGIVLLTALLAAAEPEVPTHTLKVEGRERSYLVYKPPVASGEATDRPTLPVVLAFHGGGSNAAGMMAFSGLNETARKHRFLAVYPEGIGGAVERMHTWNGGNCCGAAQRENVDDVKFVAALLDDLPRHYAINPRRVYATGMSNGAIMSYRLASELSERITAIAPVAGPMGTETCAPRRPVPVCHFHGTADGNAPFAGGKGDRSLSQTTFFSVKHSLDNWIKANGCETKPREEQLPAVENDETRVTRTTYGGGKQGAEVVLYTIHQGGHTWPGHPTRLRFLGVTTRCIDANEEMWKFFSKYELPAAR